ncbi:MAG: hypothetical protein QOI10_2137 [Solirubrobacterales bacterium]|jgi:hypothetical protein|nr:hypothetical protein [Solirubrobacterales bacterium]
MARAATAAVLAAFATVLFAAAGAQAAPRPPTAAQIERATDRFLAARPAAAPRGGGIPAGGIDGQLFPASRVVSLYGAPQMGQTVLGMHTPAGAAKRLAAQAAPYATLGDRPVIGEFDLVSVFATAGGGPDGLYRSRQADDVIGIYLEQARAVGARLMLDVQPGRSTFSSEAAELSDWLAQPDVDLALDPEWNVGRHGVPGQTPGKVGATEVNAVIRNLAALVREYHLPPKLVVVHQFRRGMVRGRSRIRPRRGVQVLLNFDGIGSPLAKAAGYAGISSTTLFNGFSLFYQRDTPLMKPAAVLGLEPAPDLLLYQ